MWARSKMLWGSMKGESTSAWIDFEEELAFERLVIY